MNESPKNLAEMLTIAGYMREERGKDVIWSIQNDHEKNAIKTKIEVLERKNIFHLNKCEVQIDLATLADQIIISAKKRFPRVKSVSSSLESDGRIRILIETTPGRVPSEVTSSPSLTLNTIGSVVGWTVSIETIGPRISVQLTDVFILGDHIDHWFADITSATTEAIAPGRKKSWEVCHLQELTLPVTALGVKITDSSRRLGNLGLQPLCEIQNATTLRASTSGVHKRIETAITGTSQVNPSPIEIIEARETAHEWKLFDEGINKRRTKNPSSTHPFTTDTLIRVAVAPNLFKLGKLDDLKQVTEASSPIPLIAMTGASTIARETGQSVTSLDITANLLRGICDRYGPLNDIEPLRRLVPEYLGDCWSKVDKSMAYKSWRASISAGGNLHRVQFKIAQLAKEHADAKTEFDAIVTLATEERRHAIASELARRLLHLLDTHPELTKTANHDLDHALMRLSSTCPENTGLILTIVRRYRNRGEVHVALSLLNRRLSDSRIQTSGHDLACLNELMADIWLREENKPQLALQRYITATTPPSEPDDKILAAAEAFFTLKGNHEQKARVTKLRVKDPTTPSGIEALETSAIYFIENGMKAEAAADIMLLISNGRVRNWYLDILEGSENLTAALQAQLAEVFLLANTSGLPSDTAIHWKINAAKVGLRFTGTRAQALKIIHQNNIMKHLSPKDAADFYTNFVDLKRLDLAADMMRVLLTAQGSHDNIDLIDQILKHKLTTDDGLFENAIAEYSSGKADTSIILRRAEQLVRERHEKSLQALCKCVIAANAGSQNLILYLDRLIEMLTPIQDVDFKKILEYLVYERKSIGGFTASEARILFELLFRSENIDLAKLILEDAISHGNMICNDDLVISQMLSEKPHFIAKWHLVRASTFKEEVDQTRELRSAIRIWLKTDERPRELLDALSDLGALKPLSRADISLLEQLVNMHNELSLFPVIISRQLDIQSSEYARDLIHAGLRFVISRLDDMNLALKLFSEWSLIHPATRLEDAYTRAYLQLKCNLINDAQITITRALSDPELLSEEHMITVMAKLLFKTQLDRGQFAGILQTLVSWAKTSGNQTLTEQLKTLSIEWNLAGLDELKTEFISVFSSANIDYLAAIAIQILIKAERLPGGAQTIIDDWMASPIIGQNLEKWWSLVKLLTTDHYLGQLKRSGRCDVLFAYAMSLFHNESTRVESISQLESISDENPLDARVWIPLYTLYEESKAHDKLITHLERIIPQIQRDRSILESTPFNIESLKNSLRRARRLEFDQSPTQSPRPNTGKASKRSKRTDAAFIQRRTAEMQREWLTALPVVAIGAVQDTHTEIKPIVTPIKNPLQEALEAPTPSHHTQDNSATTPDAGATSESTPNNTDKSAARESKPQEKDWRDAVLDLSAAHGSVGHLLNAAQITTLEKHVAIQCLALVSGEMQALESWQWPVWRRIDKFDYPLSPATRLLRGTDLRAYDGPLHNLLRLMTPMLLSKFRHRAMILPHLTRLGASTPHQSTEVSIRHPAIARGALQYFERLSHKLRIRYFDTVGLGADVFFDIQQQAIHFDAKWQAGLPPGVLAYRVLEILDHVEQNNIALTSFDPEKEVMTLIADLRSVLTATGLKRFRVAFGMEHKELSALISQVNRNNLTRLLSQCQAVTHDDIKGVQAEIRIKALQTILASTLDIIGVMESLCGRDLCADGVLRATKIDHTHPLAAILLKIATQLSL